MFLNSPLILSQLQLKFDTNTNEIGDLPPLFNRQDHMSLWDVTTAIWFRPIRSSNGQDHRLTALRSQLNGQVCGVRAQNFAHNLLRICTAGASGSTIIFFGLWFILAHGLYSEQLVLLIRWIYEVSLTALHFIASRQCPIYTALESKNACVAQHADRGICM